MTCPHDDRLLDLVLGEIPPAEAAALRAEAAVCPHCQGALGQLELGAALAARMPLEAPPMSMDAAILAAAADKASAMAGQKSKAAVPVDEPQAVAEDATGLWDRLVAWVSGITVGPQLAMASVMVLVVSIGLFYLPNGGSDPVARTQVTADPEGEAISALPEESFEELAPTPESSEAPAVALNVGEADEDANDPGAPVRPRAYDNRQEQGSASGYAGNRALEDRAAPPPAERADDDLARGRTARTRAPAREQRTAARMEAQSARLNADDPLPSWGETSMSSAMSSVPSAPSTSNAGVGGSAGSAYDEGVAQYRGGNFREAEAEFEAAAEPQAQPPRDLIPNSLLQRARSHRRANNCRDAVSVYDDLLRRFPSFAQTPQALVEAADCHRRMNQLRQARSKLERARRYASTQATAVRELRRIETLERATRRRAARPAGVDSFESAAEAY